MLGPDLVEEYADPRLPPRYASRGAGETEARRTRADGESVVHWFRDVKALTISPLDPDRRSKPWACADGRGRRCSSRS